MVSMLMLKKVAMVKKGITMLIKAATQKDMIQKVSFKTH